eukprot:Gregarina_sp_Poly_1__7340@NODE_404_length_8848_cov_317_412026_g277_i1_p3_GENE_NODE_404_length_8848_cov_317_412026_g277_i1NODE_404_length_8848_cov_317_412026_g277_i1_p3_ORF_typecomplete_len639_score121_29PP2C/PF00481_21/0_00012PP2C_2/PF13672_6/0_00034_NODE_404_length_8848_cov_317_412026_g277_i13772293
MNIVSRSRSHHSPSQSTHLLPHTHTNIEILPKSARSASESPPRHFVPQETQSPGVLLPGTGFSTAASRNSMQHSALVSPSPAANLSPAPTEPQRLRSADRVLIQVTRHGTRLIKELPPWKRSSASVADPPVSVSAPLSMESVPLSDSPPSLPPAADPKSRLKKRSSSKRISKPSAVSIVTIPESTRTFSEAAMDFTSLSRDQTLPPVSRELLSREVIPRDLTMASREHSHQSGGMLVSRNSLTPPRSHVQIVCETEAWPPLHPDVCTVPATSSLHTFGTLGRPEADTASPPSAARDADTTSGWSNAVTNSVSVAPSGVSVSALSQSPARSAAVSPFAVSGAINFLSPSRIPPASAALSPGSVSLSPNPFIVNSRVAGSYAPSSYLSQSLPLSALPVSVSAPPVSHNTTLPTQSAPVSMPPRGPSPPNLGSAALANDDTISLSSLRSIRPKPKKLRRSKLSQFAPLAQASPFSSNAYFAPTPWSLPEDPQPLRLSSFSAPQTSARETAKVADTPRATPMAVLLSLEGFKVFSDGSKSHVNQDRSFIHEVAPNVTVFAVFDGHGDNGHHVAQFVSNAFQQQLVADFPRPSTPTEVFTLSKSFTEAHILSWLRQNFTDIDVGVPSGNLLGSVSYRFCFRDV